MEEKELFRQLDILKEMGFGELYAFESRPGYRVSGRRVDEDCGEMPGSTARKSTSISGIYDEDRWPPATQAVL